MNKKRIKITRKIALMSTIILISAILLISCSGTGKVLTEKNNGDNITLKVNESVEIKLESNPSTGYGWFLNNNVDKKIISVTGPEFLESQKDKEVVGEGGNEIFLVKAISKGKSNLKLDYKRLWEKNEESSETFSITITVK